MVLAASMAIAVGCGGASQRAEDPAPAASSAAAQASPPDAPPVKDLRRADVQRTLREGLGAFLQRVEVEEAMEGGKFKGFRIRALHGDGWKGVDLQPGDVVTRVNGFSVESPDTALEAFRSLDVASELRVDYEREGAPRALRYAASSTNRPSRAERRVTGDAAQAPSRASAMDRSAVA